MAHCKKSKGCTYVRGYTTKKGTKVKGRCQSKGKRRRASKAKPRSACNKKKMSACKTSTGCSWSRGYTTKKGTKVSGSCRTRRRMSSKRKRKATGGKRKLSAYNKFVKKFAKENPGLGKNFMKKAASAWKRACN